jgi:hypothetical protein
MALKTLKAILCAGLFVSSLYAFLVYQSGWCADVVNVKDGLLSVNLKETSLLDVARDIERQSGVWFRGDETLFQEKISMTFNDLPLEEGLKRILANLNYSLMFDAKNQVAGVMVMGEGAPAATQPGRPGAQPPRVVTPPRTSARPVPTVRSRPYTSPAATVRRPPRVVPQPAQGGAAENAPAPRPPVVSDGPLPQAFQVIENAPPPGGTPQGAAVSPGDSKPSASAPATGEGSKSDSTP